MSYSISYASLADLEANIPITAMAVDSLEAQEHIEAARRLVSRFMAHEVIPGEVFITISGHANPGHKPTPGYSNDFISIYISQK